MPYERMEKALKVISPEYRADIQKQIDASEDVMYKRMENMRPRFDKINTILTAEHFDREALKAAFNDMSKHNDMRDNIQNLLISIAIILPDEERAKFFMAAAPDGPPRGPGPGPGGPPECARP